MKVLVLPNAFNKLRRYSLSKFTYIFRKKYYRLRLFWRFIKHEYYGPWEIVDPLFNIPFEIFCEYYEQCDIKNIGRVESDNEYDKEFVKEQNDRYDELDKLYHWYKYELHEKQEEIDYLLSLWSEHYVSWFEPIEENGETFLLLKSISTKYTSFLSDLLNNEELKFWEKKQDSLMKLVKYRRSLWH